MADKDSRAFPFETPHADIRRLRAENARLRQLLRAHGIPIPPLGLEDRLADVLPSSSAHLPAPVVTTPVAYKPQEKKVGPAGTRVGDADSEGTSIERQIALMRNLFHGRDDIYARRWQSTDGTRAGYMPASLKD
jgi:hypothetical protein